MKRIVSVLLLCSLLLSLSWGSVRAADGEEQLGEEQLDEEEIKLFREHLNQDELAYLQAMAVAYGDAEAALEGICDAFDDLLFPSFVPRDETDITMAWLDAVRKASGQCTAVAGELRLAPPSSLSKAAARQNMVAETLDGAFSSCMPLLKGEVR